jgi:hypothetical protein
MTYTRTQVVYLMRRFGLTEAQAAAVANLVWGTA